MADFARIGAQRVDLCGKRGESGFYEKDKSVRALILQIWKR